MLLLADPQAAYLQARSHTHTHKKNIHSNLCSQNKGGSGAFIFVANVEEREKEGREEGGGQEGGPGVCVPETIKAVRW